MADEKEISLDSKDVPMDDVLEVEENELLESIEKTSVNGELEEASNATDAKVESDEGTDVGVPQNTEKEKKGIENDEDDGGAASDAEFAAEDDRGCLSGEMKWRWHIEFYPITSEDLQLENFQKICNAASHFQIFFREHAPGLKKGEAHFYTQELSSAKTIMRTLCCRKFSCQRPYFYIYFKRNDSCEDIETACLRLDLLESAKMRWDRQKKTKGEIDSRIAKVSNVPLGVSKDLLTVVFARAFQIKRETDKSGEEEKESKEKADKAGSSEKQAENGDEKKEVINEENTAEEKEENIAEDEELDGEFNGNLTIDCCSRTSLKGFLLGYRKVVIGENVLEIVPEKPDEIDVAVLRKEARKKKRDEEKSGKEWVPAPISSKPYENRDNQRNTYNAGRWRDGNQHRSDRGSGDGRGPRGGQGGGIRGGGNQRDNMQGGGRGGKVMTGRQKMNEKSMRRGGGGGFGGRDFRDIRDIRGGVRSNFSSEIMMLQSQLQMNTMELQRQIATLNAGGSYRGYGSPLSRDYLLPSPYDMPLPGGAWMGGGRDWDYGPPSSGGRYNPGRKNNRGHKR